MESYHVIHAATSVLFATSSEKYTDIQVFQKLFMPAMHERNLSRTKERVVIGKTIHIRGSSNDTNHRIIFRYSFRPEVDFGVPQDTRARIAIGGAYKILRVAA